MVLFGQMANCVRCGAKAPLPVSGLPVCAACNERAVAQKAQEEKFAAIATTSQYDLLDLLMSDLERGFACLENSKSSAEQGQRDANISKARESLDQVRLFTGRVRDPEQRKRVEDRTEELARAISSLETDPKAHGQG
jgi:hypothetical protein